MNVAPDYSSLDYLLSTVVLFKIMNPWNLPNSEKDALNFFQEKGLLPAHRDCKNDYKKKNVHQEK